MTSSSAPDERTRGAGSAPRARVVLVAAGASTRMRRPGDANVRKVWEDLGGRPVLEVAAAAVTAAPEVVELVVVAHAEDVEPVRAHARGRAAFARLVDVVAGGAERADSVRLGVRVPGSGVDVVAVHDAARPLVEPATVSAAIRLAHARGAALVALPVTDSIHESEDGEVVTRALARERLWAAQTPQCFDAARFLDVLTRAEADGLRPTDDAALWEHYVGPVGLVAGHPTNRKLTTREDLAFARATLAAREQGGTT